MQNKKRIAAFILGAVVAFGGSVVTAQCSSCQNGSFFGGAFSGHSGSGRVAQHRENFRIWHDDFAEKAAIIEKRNYAWPKPFACQDRDTYFQTMAATYDAGWIAQCTLTDVHFDENGQLNLAGQNKVQSIMANNPLDRRNVYILHNLNVLETQSRLENVQSSVGKWYGADLANNVVATDRLPQEVSGQRIERINSMYSAKMPVPMIQIDSAGGSGGGSSGGSSSGSGATK